MKSASRPAASDSAAAVAPGSDDDGVRVGIGPLGDSDIQEAIYKGIEAKVAGSRKRGQGNEVETELGDLESFKFTVVKLTKGADDVSGSGSALLGAQADGMDVQVTGWYKRTVSAAPAPSCASFDLLVTISRQGGVWHLKGETPLSFQREDSEDCF